MFLGIDIAKASMDCAILAGPGGKPLGRRSFPNSAEGVDRAVRWAARVSGAEVAETHVVVEATAAYHELAAHRLAAAGMRVSIVNPARVRSFARALGILGKTDRIDARLLARYGQLVGPKLWSPPAKALLDLRSLIARLDDLEADSRRPTPGARRTAWSRHVPVAARSSSSVPCSRASRRWRPRQVICGEASPPTSPPMRLCRPIWSG